MVRDAALAAATASSSVANTPSPGWATAGAVQLGTHGRLAGELGVPGLADAPPRPLDDVGDLALVHRRYLW